MNWRFLYTGYNNAFFNMAVDEVLMNLCEQNCEPILRIYSWEPCAVSLGYFQKLEKAVNIDECKRQNIDIVRRLTGGRAVIHHNEITYSVIIPQSYEEMPPSIAGSYKFLCEGIIAGLKNIGIEASLDSGKRKQPIKGSAVCFDSPSMNEIVHEGKKLVGSAQVRKNQILLQHGSIPISIEPEKYKSLLKYSSERVRDLITGRLKDNVGSLSDILDKKYSLEELGREIKRGFEGHFGIDFIESDLTEWELKMAEQISKRYKM